MEDAADWNSFRSLPFQFAFILKLISSAYFKPWIGGWSEAKSNRQSGVILILLTNIARERHHIQFTSAYNSRSPIYSHFVKNIRLRRFQGLITFICRPMLGSRWPWEQTLSWSMLYCLRKGYLASCTIEPLCWLCWWV